MTQSTTTVECMPTQPIDLGLGSAAFALVGQPGMRSTHISFPTSSKPRLLVPRARARAAAESVRQYTVPDSTRTRWGLAVAGALSRLGATRLVARGVSLGGPGTFIDHLHSVLGRDDLVTAVHLGPPRANRKPVLRVMDEAGRPVAFAKLGINELTCRRVRHEADALVSLQSRAVAPLVTPMLIDVGVWSGLDYFVMEPVAIGSAQMPRRDLRREGCRALRSAFPAWSTTLAEAPWWVRVWGALEDVDDSPEAVRLTHAARRLLDSRGSTILEWGAGHGDWSRWNMSASDTGLFVWDWERFATDVPRGWDELHFAIGSHPNGVSAALADPEQLIGEALSEFPRDVSSVLLATYLIQRGAAYLADRQFEAGARTGALGKWLLPTLEEVTGWVEAA